MHTQNIALIPDCISEQLNGGKRSGGGKTNTVAQANDAIVTTTLTGGLSQTSLALTNINAFGPLAPGAITVTNNLANNAYKY